MGVPWGSYNRQRAYANTVVVKTAAGNIRVDREAAAAFQGFINELVASGYKIRNLGSFNARPNVNNKSEASNHAFGRAIDINPDTNPNGSSRTDMDVNFVRALAGKYGLKWGLDFKGTKDPMHFEWRGGASAVSQPGRVRGLTREQLRNAETIYRVGQKMGMSERDIQIALATAYQESRLRNLKGGDRDSQGLFQQRPSQGWGSPAQVTNPEYAAAKFFAALKKVGNRDSLSLTQAAQAVQRSGFPNAYAKWENLSSQLLGQLSGGSGGGPVPAAGGSTWDGQDFEAALKALGFSAAFINSDPELKRIFQQATQQQWTSDRFATAVQNTKWWKSRSQSVRAYDQLRFNDPEEWRRQYRLKTQTAQDLAGQMGVRVTSARLDAIVKSAMKAGMDENGLRDMVAAEFSFDPKRVYGGEAGKTIDQLNQIAAAYGQGVSDKFKNDFTQKVIAGDRTVDEFKALMQKQATSARPWLKQQFDSGMTLDDVAEPYRQAMAKILELSPDAVKMDDPLMSLALGAKDSKGNLGLMTQYDFEQKLRQDPRWGFTGNARDTLGAAAQTVLKAFGVQA